MTRSDFSPTARPHLGTVRRKAMSLTATDLVHLELVTPQQPLPMVIRPAIADLNLVTWAAGHQDFIAQHLRQAGGILFRNFQVKGAAEFEQFVQTVGGPLLTYTYGSTPRTQVQGQIYTSTEYPADQSIPLHNELAYSRHWPLKIAFFCVQPAASGGMTPIADSRRVFQRLDPQLRDRLRERQIMYVRNYGDGLDLSWQHVFQTEDKAVVEAYCQQAEIEWAWQGDRLTTRQVCQAVTTHGETGVEVWFNQAHLFHVSSLKPEVQAALRLGGGFPRNAYYGDGSEIEPTVLQAIREAYSAETVRFPWQAGDVLLLDNLLTAHGRDPFAGDRKVLVGMAEPNSTLSDR
ncbi:MAG: TauD/TfdA family dioxygenase [Tildeniella torsiva UHER 1998/13D]|jgi:alpha-ketoglutarate-dependent taurine dioxygenase|nr:TauD/TfdA family dioxygenase [Tildeniella torsiva UHER 1998/13D]